jgi:predicted ArsR family transcriptional regulator
MQSGEQSSEFRVADAVQAAALENRLRARLLMACASTERSLSDLERLTGQPLSKLHYHVGRLLAAKLLRVSRTQARAGRPIRFFRAVAECFVVPQELLGDLPGDALAAELRGLLQMNRGEVALRYAADARGNFTVKLVREESGRAPKAIELWQVFRLSRQQRDALAGELLELFERYGRAEPGSETILAHAAFAPRG